MTLLTLCDLDLHPNMAVAFAKAGIRSPLDIVTYSSGELARLTHLKLEVVERIVKEVTHQLNKTLIVDAATELEGEAQLLAPHCRSIERLLRGGIRTSHITEIVGDPGSGKTQICMQLALAVQIPTTLNGLAAGALYLCTEGSLSKVRLGQMSRHMQNELEQLGVNPIPNFSDNIYLQNIADQKELLACLHHKVPLLLAKTEVKLMIIDSVAAIFRFDYTADEMDVRSRDLRSIGQELHQLCAQFQVAILCVNQVSASVSSGPGGGNVPSLGLVWADLIHTRLVVTRTNREAEVLHAGKTFLSAVREVAVEFSPYLAPGKGHFLITDHGLSSIRLE